MCTTAPLSSKETVATTAKWLRFLGRLDEAHPPMPFANQLDEFLKNLREERGLADSTVEHRTRTLAQFFRWLVARSRSIATADPRDITEYFSAPRSPSWKRATVKSYAECLRRFFRYAESRSWCNPGLAATIDAPRIFSFEPPPQGPAWKDAQRLIASVNGDHSDCCQSQAIAESEACQSSHPQAYDCDTSPSRWRGHQHYSRVARSCFSGHH
jgi:integrase/recombinase XerD